MQVALRRLLNPFLGQTSFFQGLHLKNLQQKSLLNYKPYEVGRRSPRLQNIVVFLAVPTLSSLFAGGLRHQLF